MESLFVPNGRLALMWAGAQKQGRLVTGVGAVSNARANAIVIANEPATNDKLERIIQTPTNKESNCIVGHWHQQVLLRFGVPNVSPLPLGGFTTPETDLVSSTPAVLHQSPINPSLIVPPPVVFLVFSLTVRSVLIVSSQLNCDSPLKVPGSIPSSGSCLHPSGVAKPGAHWVLLLQLHARLDRESILN